MSRDLPPTISANETKSDNKGFMAKLSKSAGAATKLVALQTERTKLNTLTLPAAYRALGKDCLQQKRHLDCVPELTSQLRSVLAEIKQLAETAAAQVSPRSLTDKAKAAGKYAVDAARQKQLGMKRDSLIASIGKAIYDKHLDAGGPIELVEPIASSIARIAQIDTEIGQQSQVGKGSFVTPKRMLVGVGLILALFTAYLVVPRTSGDRNWKAESEDERASAIAKHEPQFLQMLQAGDSAWDEGKKPEAVQHYSQLLGQFCGHGQSDRTEVARQRNPEMARAAGRAIDFLADNGNDETAKDLIRKAGQSNLVIVYNSTKVNRLVIEAKADERKDEKEVDDWHQRGEQNERENTQSKFPTSANDKSLTDNDFPEWNQRLMALRKIRGGMNIEQVEGILGLADETDTDNDPTGILAERGETLTILTWRGDDPGENGDFIKIGFINDRLKDLSFMSVNAAKQ